MSLAIKDATEREWAKRFVIPLRALLRANEFYLIPLAIVIGVASGAIVTGMAQLAQIAHVVIYGIPLDQHLSANERVAPWVALTAPTLGGQILGLMEYLRRRWKISNAVDPIEANALRGGQMSMRDSVVVSTQTLISNGCGASVGLEAGYTQIGAGLSSLVGQFLNLRRNDLRLMVGCGAAAAIAGAFGAPITGAFYACELIVGVYSVASAAPILAAALAGGLTAKWLGGAPYSLALTEVNTVGFEQYLALLCLALVTGAVGIAVMRSATAFERVFAQKWLPVWLRPAVGGLCVGALAIVTPQVLAAGHGAMVLDLHAQMTITMIATIVALKVVACLISLASGFRGGLFFASLFVGSLIGKFFAAVLLLVSPTFAIDPLVAMLTGMATLGVAIIGGPLTMSFLVLEMTRNVDVTAVVLAGCILTSICVRFSFGHSFSTWRLHLRGETIRSANDVGWLRNLTVLQMMRSDFAAVRDDVTVADARAAHALGSRKGIALLDADGNYAGLVMLPTLFASSYDGEASTMPIRDIAAQRDAVLLPEMNAKTAMGVFDRAEAELLFVVASMSDRRVTGLLSESFVRRRYSEELDKANSGILGARG